MKFPTFDDIIKTNRRHLDIADQRMIGGDNLKEPGSLKWVLDAIQYPLFGIDPYPTIIEKSSILAWTIIAGHVFWDGNQRTGMSVLINFLRLNGFNLSITNDDIVKIAKCIAREDPNDNYSHIDFITWIRKNIIFYENTLSHI